MTREGKYLVFCVERYKAAKNLTGVQVSELFTKYQVWEYVYECFGALHTTGELYMIDDIDQFIEARKENPALLD